MSPSLKIADNSYEHTQNAYCNNNLYTYRLCKKIPCYLMNYLYALALFLGVRLPLKLNTFVYDFFVLFQILLGTWKESHLPGVLYCPIIVCEQIPCWIWTKQYRCPSLSIQFCPLGAQWTMLGLWTPDYHWSVTFMAKKNKKDAGFVSFHSFFLDLDRF